MSHMYHYETDTHYDALFCMFMMARIRKVYQNDAYSAFRKTLRYWDYNLFWFWH